MYYTGERYPEYKNYTVVDHDAHANTAAFLVNGETTTTFHRISRKDISLNRNEDYVCVLCGVFIDPCAGIPGQSGHAHGGRRCLKRMQKMSVAADILKLRQLYQGVEKLI